MSEGIVIALIGGVFTLVGSLLPRYLPEPRRTTVPATPQGDVTLPPASSAGAQPIQMGKVIRDVGIIWILTGLAGFMIGLSMGNSDPEGLLIAAGLSNIVFGTVGFAISGSLTKVNRWKHLLAVAIGVWLSSFINIFLIGVDIGQWFMSLFLVLIMMAVGGAFSYLFNR